MSLLHWIGSRRPCFLAGVVSLVMLLAAGSQAKVPRAELKGADNTVVRSYIWGLDVAGDVNYTGGVGGLAAVKHATGGTHFAITDGSGNVAGLINAADGTQSATYEYDPFGQTLRKSGVAADLNPLRFSSRYTDSETGTLYYGFRYYAPATGWWLNRDPIGEWGGLNLYGFANNDPVNSLDLLGLAVGDWRDPQTHWCRMKGEWGAGKEAVEDFVDGISNPKETLDSIVGAVSNPVETAKAIKDQFVDGYKEYNENKFGCGDPCEALKTEGKVRANLAMAAFGGGTIVKGFGQFRKLNGAARGTGGVLSNADDAFNRMLQAGQAADRRGLTKAGRALDKHGGRGGIFPKATGNVAAKNAQGQQVLQEILSAQPQTISPNRLGGRDIFDPATGRRVRFDGNGKMMGFLKPGYGFQKQRL